MQQDEHLTKFITSFVTFSSDIFHPVPKYIADHSIQLAYRTGPCYDNQVPEYLKVYIYLVGVGASRCCWGFFFVRVVGHGTWEMRVLNDNIAAIKNAQVRAKKAAIFLLSTIQLAIVGHFRFLWWYIINRLYDHCWAAFFPDWLAADGTHK